MGLAIVTTMANITTIHFKGFNPPSLIAMAIDTFATALVLARPKTTDHYLTFKTTQQMSDFQSTLNQIKELAEDFNFDWQAIHNDIRDGKIIASDALDRLYEEIYG